MPKNIVPKKFFITAGKALSKVSEINAFDKALVNAGIAEANLVPVSSVLPAGITRISRARIERGMITFCVLSRIDGKGECKISAGLAYGLRKDGNGGYVAEAQVRGDSKALSRELKARLAEMADHRGVGIEHVEFEMVSLSVPKRSYGSCVVALVFCQ